MRICFVGPSESSHIIKWCDWFNNQGHEVHVISFTNHKIDSANVHTINIGVDPNGNELQKIKYMLTGKKIKKIVEEIKPDVINAHYATSYGVAMALSGVKNYVLSIWGSDIFEFPQKSPLHKALLKFSLKNAPYLFSTSRAMSDEARKYVNRKFYITPFGVDMDLFSPIKRTRSNSDDTFIIGTVKGLNDNYGIKYILMAASEVVNNTQINLKLRIAGKGDKEQEYRDLAKELGIDDITNWLGYISQEQAAIEWANMDLAVIPSINESFGVSAVEAQACGTPVIISYIPGLMEATDPGKSSIVVNRKDHHQIAEAIKDMYYNNEKRLEMGAYGRRFAIHNYELNRCFKKIENYYEKILERK